MQSAETEKGSHKAKPQQALATDVGKLSKWTENIVVKKLTETQALVSELAATMEVVDELAKTIEQKTESISCMTERTFPLMLAESVSNYSRDLLRTEGLEKFEALHMPLLNEMLEVFQIGLAIPAKGAGFSPGLMQPSAGSDTGMPEQMVVADVITPSIYLSEQLVQPSRVRLVVKNTLDNALTQEKDSCLNILSV